jgi:hypothetical protein
MPAEDIDTITPVTPSAHAMRHSFVRPVPRDSVPTTTLAAAARRACQDWPSLRGHPEGLALTGPSTASRLSRSGLEAPSTRSRLASVLASFIPSSSPANHVNQTPCHRATSRFGTPTTLQIRRLTNAVRPCKFDAYGTILILHIRRRPNGERPQTTERNKRYSPRVGFLN